MSETQLSSYAGLLVIGDPHFEGRQPGFRKDNYPEVILEKFDWCLNYAKQHSLLPAFLGDFFDKPRDNPTWMLGRLIEILSKVECLGIYGNHDCADPRLCEHDSLDLLIKAGCVQLVSEKQPWRGRINGRPVVIGGSSYRIRIPDQFERHQNGEKPLVLWLAHHDVLLDGYDQGVFKPFAINGIDVVVNGHIHRRLNDVRAGPTLWITPGNISRRKRNDAAKDHIPSALRIDVNGSGFVASFVEIPHEPFENVFHSAITDVAIARSESAFIRGLAELQARRTQSGAGFVQFLESNLSQFEVVVAEEIMILAKEVIDDGQVIDETSDR